MKYENYLLDKYEQTRLVRYDETETSKLIRFSELTGRGDCGVLKASFHSNGELMQIYSGSDAHVGIIAATGLGKTTSFVINQAISFAVQNVKRSIVISDPKGELYRLLADLFKENGYDVRLFNFRDATHSECWNPLTPIFRKYRKAYDIFHSVKVVKTDEGIYNIFEGKIYRNQRELDEILSARHEALMNDVGTEIDKLTLILFPTRSTKDPTWEDSARDVLKGLIWGLLEDSIKENLETDMVSNCRHIRKLITEDNFSLASALKVFNSFEEDSSRFFDFGFFASRKNDSRAKMYVNNLLLNNAPVTRRGIISTFIAGSTSFRESAIQLVMSNNSLEFSQIAERPTVIFINYKDEVKLHYEVISMLVQDIYGTLIECANKNGDGRLKTPFYFILDEFGNFPRITDFETTISACRGRNIFFMLVIQSYAQLNAVYGKAVAEIIRDNLNIHIFFGSNNPSTLNEFSKECGEFTRFSPFSALNGNGTEICNYEKEVIPVMPRSTLSNLQPGECVVTEANCGYVLFSMMERYYTCPEFNGLKFSLPENYGSTVNVFDKKYRLDIDKRKTRGGPFDIE